jgi:hypothetical protein
VERPSPAEERALATLRAELKRHLDGIHPVAIDAPEIDAEMRESLRALGYLE